MWPRPFRHKKEIVDAHYKKYFGDPLDFGKTIKHIRSGSASDVEAANPGFGAKHIGDAEEIKNNIFNHPKERAETLYGRLFGAFEHPLKKVKKLFVAPDGFLSLIPFASLIMPNGKYMAERFQINRLLTGRDFMGSPPDKPISRLIAMGGIDYGTFESNKPALKTEAARLNRRAAAELKEGMAYLPHSKREADLIATFI